MSGDRKRLDKIRARLSAKQRVIQWLEEALAFDSPEAYVDSRFEQFGGARPWGDIASDVEAGVQCAMKGSDRETVAQTVRTALRDACFLSRLVLNLNWFVNEPLTTLRLRAALGARGLQLGLASGVAGARGWTRLGRARHEVHALAQEVFGIEAVVALIRRRYFNGHAILFPCRQAAMADLTETVRVLADECNRLATEQTDQAPGAKGPANGATDSGRGAREVSRVDLEAAQDLAKSRAVSAARFQVDMAKADTLVFLEDIEGADRVLGPYLGRSHGPFGPWRTTG